MTSSNKISCLILSFLREILDKDAMSLFLENMVSSNIVISQLIPVPISPKPILNKQSQVEPVVIMRLSRKIASEEFLCFLRLQMLLEF